MPSKRVSWWLAISVEFAAVGLYFFLYSRLPEGHAWHAVGIFLAGLFFGVAREHVRRAFP